MSHLIDSDLLIDHLEREPTAVRLLASLAPLRIATSVINYMEVYQGILRSPQRQVATTQFEALMNSLVILPTTVLVAKRCAELREHLRLQGKRVHSRAMDLLIASTALHYGLVLVTRNKHDYADIPGLTLL